MARKSQDVAPIRLAGLDLCDAVVENLCVRGLLAVTPEALRELEQQERSLQSYKLSRFSRDLTAIRARLAAALQSGGVNARVFADRLARLRAASAHLRRLLADPYADPREIEEVAGRTWRESDLERRENLLLAEMAWESIELEEGFRIDSSYFPGEKGSVLCERKIVPLQIRAAIDDSLKQQRPVPGIYPVVGLYPGDLPRRIKILDTTRTEETPSPAAVQHQTVRDLVSDASSSIEELRRRYLERRSRPFPPDTMPFIAASPRFQRYQHGWRILDPAGDWLDLSPAPGARRTPGPEECAQAFEDCILSTPVDAVLLLVHDDGNRIAASPIGAVTPERILRFGLDTD